MAAPTCGLTTIQRFTYRGNANEEWSNHYWFTGSTPADSTAWRALFDALVVPLKACFSNATQVVGGYGYDSVDPTAHAIWTVDLTVSPNTPVAGTYTTGGQPAAPGDVAAWLRWGLNRYNSKGKRIYLRKYFHDSYPSTDALATAQKNAYLALGAKLDDGTFIDGRKITDKLGTATVGHAVGAYATTRTLKRRGKRPPT